MKHQFSSSEEQRQSAVQSEHQLSQQNQAGREFASAEELLRFDAAQVQPPESIATRLRDSLAAEPAPPMPWWRRFWPW